MKNRSLLFALALSIGLFTTSCSSDDNDGETLIPLAGKWNITKVGSAVGSQEFLIDPPENEPGCNKDYLDLKINNDVNYGDYNSEDSPCQLIIKTGTYSRSHNNLTTTKDGTTTVRDIMNLTLTELKVKDASGVISLYVRD